MAGEAEDEEKKEQRRSSEEDKRVKRINKPRKVTAVCATLILARILARNPARGFYYVVCQLKRLLRFMATGFFLATPSLPTFN